ncbi:MAG: hypothetical protein GY699_26670 [Desulfobacteraceae bacterium]|nr:hypothetical protein [Desulfobacteraceae bacterium]
MKLVKGSVGVNENGGILIAVIVTMVVISALGAGLVSITGTSVFNQTISNSSSNASHLAEAGYRYAQSNIQTIGAIHGETFTLDSGNSFTITVNTYDFDIQGVSGTTILETQIPYGDVPFSDVSISGRIAVGNTIYEYTSISVTGNDVDFTIPGGGLPTTGKVRLAALKQGNSTITENDTITLRGTNPTNLFPANNGAFTVGSDQYRYRSKTEDTLVGITSADGHWPGDFTLNNNDPVILDNFIEVQSTGNYGSALTATNRLMAYNILLDGGTGENEIIDHFDDRDDWSPNAGPGSTGEGTFDIGNIDGNNALTITSTTDVIGSIDTSSINFNWQGTDLDLNVIWSNNSNMLSYNAQIKIMMDGPDPSTYEPAYQGMADNYFYMTGLNFRKRDNGDSYGLSFYRAEPDNADGIPDSFNPNGGGDGNGGQAMVLLWERIGAYGVGWRWLAYANLSDVNIMREPQAIFEDDFETDLSNWIAGVPDSFNFETITSHDGNPSQTITDSPGEKYKNNKSYMITSNAIDISGLVSLSLSFWHKYRTEARWDICEVEVKPNNGNWQTLATYDGNHNAWEQVSFGLDGILPADSIQIRFTLDTDGSVRRRGWNIDDVKLETLFPKWMTLMLHLEEKDILGTKTNEIKAYVSDETLRGTANDDPQDNNRLNNPRGDINWPPDNVDDTDAGNDHFTLIKWDGINTGVTLTGVGKELESIIQVDSITSPDVGAFTQAEFGLHSWGWNYNVSYFDDFSIQTQ